MYPETNDFLLPLPPTPGSKPLSPFVYLTTVQPPSFQPCFLQVTSTQQPGWPFKTKSDSAIPLLKAPKASLLTWRKNIPMAGCLSELKSSYSPLSASPKRCFKWQVFEPQKHLSLRGCTHSSFRRKCLSLDIHIAQGLTFRSLLKKSDLSIVHK